MNTIKTQNAPGAIGPYSQGYEVNGMICTSGQLPVCPSDGSVPEGIQEQARQSCENVKAVIEAAGGSMSDVFKTTCFLASMDDFAAFNEVYAQYFPSHPARSCVAVKTLPKGVLCEIEAAAVKQKATGTGAKVTVIGSHLCPDTLYALGQLAQAGIEADFQDILSCHADLKAYLALRESSQAYENIRGTASLGIPCFVREDGTHTLELAQILAAFQ